MATPQNVPVPNQPMVDDNRQVTQAWRQFFVGLWQITGGGGGGGLTANINPSSTATGLGLYANDAAAKAAGVPQWGFYLNDSGLQVRRMP